MHQAGGCQNSKVPQVAIKFDKNGNLAGIRDALFYSPKTQKADSQSRRLRDYQTLEDGKPLLNNLLK